MLDQEQFAFTYNNSPSERLSNLSPLQFFELTHNSFMENSPVKLRENLPYSIYEQIPFLKLIESFLHLIQQEGFIKQTPTGRIPVKTLKLLYEKNHIIDEYIESGINRLSSEDYWPVIFAVKAVSKKAGLTRIEKNKIVLVKKNLAYLDPQNRESLFRAIYLSYSEEFNWAYFDGYPNVPVGQYGVNFTIYLLLKYGKTYRKDSFYAERYLKGYPNFANEFDDEHFTVEEYFNSCYSLRSFDKFTNWFGFTNTQEITHREKEIIATDLLFKIFILDI